MVNDAGAQALSETRNATNAATIEYVKQNIRVNSVCPGDIETDITRDTMERRSDIILAQVPDGRMGPAPRYCQNGLLAVIRPASFITSANDNVGGSFMAS